MIRALVFDFDGVLVETEGPVLQSWQELYRAHGLELPLEEWMDTVGTFDAEWDPWTDLQGRAGPAIDREAVEPARRERERELADAQPPMPGVVERLDEAAALGLRLAVASSSSARWVEGHLARLALLERFETVVTRDRLLRTKPDPEAYLTVLGDLGIAGRQAVALEDSAHGVASAKAAGLWCVAVPSDLTRHMDLSAADARCESLAGVRLGELLERFGS